MTADLVYTLSTYDKDRLPVSLERNPVWEADSRLDVHKMSNFIKLEFRFLKLYCPVHAVINVSFRKQVCKVL
jgi:hypothetical protein